MTGLLVHICFGGVLAWGSAAEASGCRSWGLIEGGLAALDDLGVPAGVQIGGPQVGEAVVVVRVVVPVEVVAAPGAGRGEALEARRVVGPGLEGLELGLRVGVGEIPLLVWPILQINVDVVIGSHFLETRSATLMCHIASTDALRDAAKGMSGRPGCAWPSPLQRILVGDEGLPSHGTCSTCPRRDALPRALGQKSRAHVL
jgi:hypothetical protein